MKLAVKLPRVPIQFSLKSILLFIVAMSLGLAALRSATIGWVVATSFATTLVIPCATVIGVYGTAEKRPFWGGFALCSGIYSLILLFNPASVVHNGDGPFGPTKIIELLQDEFHGTNDVATPATTAAIAEADFREMTEHFMVIGQCLWVMIFGSLGGCLAHFVSARRNSISASSAETPGA